MDQLRLFVAIELTDALRTELRQIQRQLQDERAFKNVRWVAPQNIHLTLKFLGNAASHQVTALTTAVSLAAKQSPTFTLSARGLGCFPNLNRPNNLWVGLEGETRTAALLARRIDAECEPLGFAREERGFTPHLTLGRVKREATLVERAAIGELVKRQPVYEIGTIRADAISLIASELLPAGPKYTTRARVPLGDSVLP